MQITYEEPQARGAARSQRADVPSDVDTEEALVRRAWLSALMRELFQTERSAKSHPTLESERLGDTSPGRAMRAVAEHATATLADLPRLAQRHDLPVSAGGEAVGKLFSLLRDAIGDLLLNMERSYRGTILGMRHGLDLVTLLRDVALADGDEELVEWCTTWIDKRRPLVEAAADELEWFALRPERATAPAKTGALAEGVQMIARGFEELADKLRAIAYGRRVAKRRRVTEN